MFSQFKNGFFSVNDSYAFLLRRFVDIFNNKKNEVCVYVCVRVCVCVCQEIDRKGDSWKQ